MSVRSTTWMEKSRKDSERSPSSNQNPLPKSSRSSWTPTSLSLRPNPNLSLLPPTTSNPPPLAEPSPSTPLPLTTPPPSLPSPPPAPPPSSEEEEQVSEEEGKDSEAERLCSEGNDVHETRPLKNSFTKPKRYHLSLITIHKGRQQETAQLAPHGYTTTDDHPTCSLDTLFVFGSSSRARGRRGKSIASLAFLFDLTLILNPLALLLRLLVLSLDTYSLTSASPSPFSYPFISRLPFFVSRARLTQPHVFSFLFLRFGSSSPVLHLLGWFASPSLISAL